jgi:universal stress protein F
MYRRILVPVAFDREHKPEAALAVARVLAAEGAEVTVLHVMEEAPPYALSFIPEDYLHDLKRAIAAEMEGYVAGFANGRAVLAEGHAAATILHWAEDHEVDCIVIASRRPGIQDRILGSTASYVVGRAHCAVHVVR